MSITRIGVGITSLLLCLGASVGITTPAHANENSGQGENTFSVAPGETVQWEITTGPATAPGTIHFQIEETSGDLFSGDNPITVDIFSGNEEILSDVSDPSELISLGTVEPGTATTLRAVATLPIAADDSYRNALAFVSWRFQIQETATLPHALTTTGVTPGQTMGIAAIGFVFVGSAAWMLSRSRRETRI